MNELINLNELISPNMTQVDLMPTLFSFFMCVLMSFIVRDFYIRRSFSLTGKIHIGSIIPVLSAVVFLVIIVLTLGCQFLKYTVLIVMPQPMFLLQRLEQDLINFQTYSYQRQ